MSNRLLEIKDKCDQSKVKHSIHDCFMSGFAMIFFKILLYCLFSAGWKRSFSRSNLETVFKIRSIPKDSQIRKVLDNSDNEKLQEVF